MRNNYRLLYQSILIECRLIEIKLLNISTKKTTALMQTCCWNQIMVQKSLPPFKRIKRRDNEKKTERIKSHFALQRWRMYIHGIQIGWNSHLCLHIYRIGFWTRKKPSDSFAAISFKIYVNRSVCTYIYWDDM